MLRYHKGFYILWHDVPWNRALDVKSVHARRRSSTVAVQIATSKEIISSLNKKLMVHGTTNHHIDLIHRIEAGPLEDDVEAHTSPLSQRITDDVVRKRMTAQSQFRLQRYYAGDDSPVVDSRGQDESDLQIFNAERELQKCRQTTGCCQKHFYEPQFALGEAYTLMTPFLITRNEKREGVSRFAVR
ncbi:uncharacterized protein MELLADRAFT_113372 [Melampsora larici-populina 98AG31]|uniref:Uncharacterized protein n=1 Tax=Melampsora larici-populina (strain 98AG31 / pathotype 3-4-7) TaxID=747676 RepID=F4S9N1_MELLP|nr:uncharacterized protein MELLADRAFT_113372 [Melampsora larici-populina 98AG31]EGF98667.1 hypothetical protein MELLADRAFT_113372 [Melampsora larici-populina 98AG31]